MSHNEFSIVPGVYRAVVCAQDLTPTGMMDAEVMIFPDGTGKFMCSRNGIVSQYPNVHIRTDRGEGLREIVRVGVRLNIVDD